MNNESDNNKGTLTEPAPDVSPSGASEATKAPADIVELFVQSNSLAIDEDGIRIPHAIAKDHHDSLTMMAMAFWGQSASQDLYRALFKYVEEHRPTELIFGVDRFCQPGQGTDLCDLLSVHHFRLGSGWRFGVMQYQHKPRIVREIEWDHAHWAPILNLETTGQFNRLAQQAGIIRGSRL